MIATSKFKFLDALFSISVFLLFLLPPTDPDLGWHLRCGLELWENHHLCGQNHFSVLLANYSWVNHYWLYQAAIWPIFRYLNIWGLTLVNSLIMGCAFLFFYLSLNSQRLKKIIATLAIIWAGWGVFSFGLRSQLLGFLFFNLTLLTHSLSEKKVKMAWAFPLILFFWAQTHASVVLGMVLVSFFLIVKMVRQTPKARFYLLILLFSPLSTLINPFGLKIYEEAWRHFGVVSLSSLIAEWVPPTSAIWWTILLSGIGLSLYLIISGRTKNIFYCVLLLLFAFISLRARRNIPFYLVLFFFLLLRSDLTRLLDKHTKKLGNWQKNLTVLIVSAVFFFSFFIRLPTTIKANVSWKSYLQSGPLAYPFAAVEFLRTQPEKGYLFNRYEWGGFLIWQLPEYRIFIDGRMPTWKTPSGKSPYTIYLEILQTQPGWQETLSQYKIDWILISPETFMDLWLRNQPEKYGWQRVFRDKSAVVYKRLLPKLP